MTKDRWGGKWPEPVGTAVVDCDCGASGVIADHHTVKGEVVAVCWVIACQPGVFHMTFRTPELKQRYGPECSHLPLDPEPGEIADWDQFVAGLLRP